MKRVFIYDKIKRLFSLTIIALLLSLMINSCKKDEPNDVTNGKTTAVFNPNVKYGTMTDQDRNVYKTVTIGTQTWMAENLRTTKYRDGTAIPNVTDNTAWINLTTGAYCNYNNTKSTENIATYGRLYNWYAATDSRNIAPIGWHIATDADWTTLINYLGGQSIAGDKLKETGYTHWNHWGSSVVTNETGFTALPGGQRDYDTFCNFTYNGCWWSYSVYSTYPFCNQSMVYYSSDVFILSGKKESGYSIRCVMD